MKRQIVSGVLCLPLSLAAALFAQTPDPAPAPQDRPPLSVDPRYRYEGQGRRDPFINPIPEPTAAAAAAAEVPAVRPAGLPGVLLSEVRVSGIVTSKEPGMNKVVIVAPGKKGAYFASQGDALFDAVIKEIRSNSVVFTMVSPANPQPQNRDVVRTVGTSAGENK